MEMWQGKYTAGAGADPTKASPAACLSDSRFSGKPQTGGNRGFCRFIMLTFCLPYNLLANFLDQKGNKPYKLIQSRYTDLPGVSMRIVKLGFLALLITSLFSALVYAEAPDRIAGAIDSARGVALAKSLHPKAQAQYDQGAVEPSFELSYITLTTTPSAAQQKALNRLLAQQQDPASPNYHRWLTPAEYADRFGLSRADISRITTWLKSEGFTILGVGGGRNTVIFSGTALQVQNAFKTEIHRYNVDGEEHIANSTPVMIPAALSGIVTGVRGLHDFRLQPAIRTRTFGRAGGRLRPDYYDAKWQFPSFLAPADINTIYDIPSTLDGTGEKLAVVGQADIFLADINDFRSGFNLTPISGCTLTTGATAGIVTACNTSNFRYVLVGSDASPTPGADILEADLDVEWSGAIAPKAQIIFVNSPNGGVDAALSAAINSPVAPVISMSYGICEQLSGNQETELAQADAEGISILISSGDAGAAGCDRNPPNANPPYLGAIGGLAVSYPASSSYVTAVGGTAISYADDTNPANSTYWNTTNGTNGGTAKMYIPELAWNDDENIAAYCSTPGFNTHVCEPTGSSSLVTNTAQLVQQYGWTSAAGGGASNCAPGLSNTTCTGFPQPTWQTTLSVAGLPSGDSNVRWIPDVSLLASPTFPGYILCTPQDPFPSSGAPNYTSTCDPGGSTGITNAVHDFPSIIGGTSASTPVFAAIVTLLNQSLMGPSSPGLGNINPTLYSLAKTKSNGAFHQSTGGTNNVYCQPTTPSGAPPNIVCPSAGVYGFSTANADSTTGYNLVTGLGSVDVSKLASAWAGTLSGFTLSAAPSSASVSAGNSTTSTITVAPVNGFTGTVSFTCSGLAPGASCSAPNVTGGSGTTTLTITTKPSMATGTSNVTVTGTSGVVQSTTTLSLTVTTTTQSFTLAPQNQTYQVSQGQSVTATVTLTATNGFNSPVSYTCSEQSTLTESTCTGPSGPIPATTPASFLITTTAATTRLQRPFDRGTRIFYAALLPGLLGIVFTFGSRKRSLRGMRMLGLSMVLGFSTLWLGSCGSSNSSSGNPGTPKGSYTVTVNATTGGTNPVTGTTTFTLQVQ